MRVLVCGSRDWKDRKGIRDRLERLPISTVIVEGECRGADILSREVAEKLGLRVEKYPAKWHRYGRAAGPIRNTQMVESEPDLVIAFHEDIGRSKGTVDTLKKARRKGIKTEVIGHETVEP